MNKTSKFAACLLLLALVARAAIPAGFMPAAQGKPFTLMICPGHMEGMPQPKSGHHQDTAHYMPCAFSAAFACGMIAHAPVPAAAAVLSYRNEIYPQAATAFFRCLKAFFSQGPPPAA